MQGDSITAFVTTSRKPGTNCRLFAKDLASILQATYITRGKSSLSDLIASARYNGVEKVFIVTEYAGNPRQILEITVGPKTWKFTNTYYVTLHKLRKIFTKEKIRIKDASYEGSSKAFIHLINSAGVTSVENSKFRIVEKDGIVKVFQVEGDKLKEIGPRFKIFYRESDD